jgi:galactose mutarotase-like enzyme
MGNSGVEDHELWINSDYYAPLGNNILPTGEIRHVADSVFDFRQKPGWTSPFRHERVSALSFRT